MQDEANTLRSLTLFVSSHFMFNVLGKLQSEILSGEKRDAITTLTLYSRLLRLACSIGLKSKITLAEEKDFLIHYLKLEKERFVETPFEWTILNFDDENIFIQPFILQPFLELALLGSLNANNNSLTLFYDKNENCITLTSMMQNPEAHKKLEEKCNLAMQRIEIFEHRYLIDESGDNYIQKIFL